VLFRSSFSESFALSPNRSHELSELIPGSEDYFFYTILHRLNHNSGTFHSSKSQSQTCIDDRETESLLSQYQSKFGEGNDRFRTLQARFHLLNYSKDKENVLKWIEKQLDLRFDYQKEKSHTISVPFTFPSILNQGCFFFCLYLGVLMFSR